MADESLRAGLEHLLEKWRDDRYGTYGDYAIDEVADLLRAQPPDLHVLDPQIYEADWDGELDPEVFQGQKFVRLEDYRALQGIPGRAQPPPTPDPPVGYWGSCGCCSLGPCPAHLPRDLARAAPPAVEGTRE